MDEIKNTFHFKIISNIFVLIPVALLTGPFLSDLFLSILGIYFLIISYKYSLIKYYKNIFVYFFISFYLFLLVRGLVSQYPYESLIKYNGPIFYFRYIFFVLGIKFLLDISPDLIKKFSIVLFFVILFTCIDGYVQWLFGTNLLGYQSPSIRITGIFNTEEVLGHFLSHLSPLLLALLSYVYGIGKKKIIFYILFLMFIEFMIFVTNDRAAFLKITQFTILIILLSNNFKIFRLISFLITLVVIFFVLNFSQNSNERYQQTVQDVTNTTIPYMPWSPHHETHFSVTFDMFKNNPFFGQGPQLFKTLCQIVPEYLSGCSSHPHNYYFQTMGELGIIGLFFLFSAFIYFSYILIRHFFAMWIKKNPKKIMKDYYLFTICLLFLLLWPLIPHNSFYNNWFNVMVYLPVGFFMHFKKNKNIHYE